MAFARELSPFLGIGTPRSALRGPLAILAGAIALLCCLLAFLFFVFLDQGHPNVMINEQSAPLLSVKKADFQDSASRVSGHAFPGLAANASPAAIIAKQPTKDRTAFHITRSSRIPIGPVKVKLIHTDPLKDVYDVTVFSGRRSSPHRRLKLNQPWWIVVNRGQTAIELVATSIEAGSVAGYWTESAGSPHVTDARGRSHIH